MSQETTINANVSASHKAAGLVAGQKDRSAGQLARFAETAHRCVTQDGLGTRCGGAIGVSQLVCWKLVDTLISVIHFSDSGERFI